MHVVTQVLKVYNRYITADGLAVDWISDKLYYSDDCNNGIGVLDLATNQYKMLVSGIGNNPFYHDLVVDPTTRLHIIIITVTVVG